MTNFEPKQFGKYYLLEKLAVGGMAEIYKAKTYGAEGFEKLLAIKRILPHAAADKEFITMLIDEAKLSVMLSHANIVQVYDLGKVGDDYFISMEFIHGVNMRDVLYALREKNKKMPTDLAVYAASEVCKGLDYAHRKSDANNQPLGLVHRDISPQNILVSFEGEVKIVDFGIAKAAMNISHTMAGILKGKIAYMSPEQAMGKAIDSRTDIFSLGILLYEALTGKKLYTGESQFEVLKKIRTTRIDVAKLPDSIPDAIKPILAKALAYRPEDRYSSSSDMQIALTKFLYATYTGFSPRKLAAFVQELFPPETSKEKQGDGKTLEGQTSSISLIAQGTEENFAHRDTTPFGGLGKPIIDNTRQTATDRLVGPEGAPSGRREAPDLQRKKKLGIFWVVPAVVALGLGLFIWKLLVTSTPAVKQNVQMAAGTLQVVTTPPGADIQIDGEPTFHKTPAILENLKLKHDYKIAVTLENFGQEEKTVRLENTEPLLVQMALAKNAGILNVISEPSGAAILLDGIATGKSTPATIDNLALGKEYRVSLSKPDFKDFEQPVTLMRADPQKLLVSLRPVETAPPIAEIQKLPEPLPPPTPVTPPPAPIEPEPVPPPAEIIGTLRVNSTPTGAKIFLNGRDTGKSTPALLDNLKEGRYTIRLAKEHFQSSTKNVTVSSAKEYSIAERLNEIVKQEPVAEKPPVEKTPAEKPAPTGGEGAVRISSNPSGADVFVNGEAKGTTPVSVPVRSGTVKILVTKGEDKLPCKQTLQVRPGETAQVNCSLGPLFGKIEISTTPSGADVYLNGKKLGGRTPLTITKLKRDQRHTLKLEVSGYKIWERSFNFEEGDSKAFNVDLDR